MNKNNIAIWAPFLKISDLGFPYFNEFFRYQIIRSYIHDEISLFNKKNGPNGIRTHDLSISEKILSVERSSQAELSAQEIFLVNGHLSLLAFPFDRAAHRGIEFLFFCKLFHIFKTIIWIVCWIVTVYSNHHSFIFEFIINLI